MDAFIESLLPKEWESFCEKMLRQHYGAKNFWAVPDVDRGDLGIEFFTSDGTIYQCYCPEKNADMKSYKEKIQKKINDDLKKLKNKESEIQKMLDGIVINHWVLLTPENKSKDLIPYCHKKKRETIKEMIGYVDASSFTVKIETADSFPAAKIYAQGVHCKAVNIPINEVSEQEKIIWKNANSKFMGHIVKKSDLLMKDNPDQFQERVIVKYLQIEKFLEQLRDNHPDIHANIEDTAVAQLDDMLDNSLFEKDIDSGFVQSVVNSNRDAFSKYSKDMCDKNLSSLSFGYLSKWLTECNMDFKNGK
ncbi:hypothetical protein [Cellvibrio fibrivorans]|uniref:RNase H-related nuclease YkuK (DUF458 family) n=1 Tax=Cellvibrio fibrivorans TaxID=126350 RepID=A0ABU1UTT8_9GAMM|nr:hypothetical protein [Cellvibrio fibrivorans]MDR7088591.1 putative RNase H-related nuclease YkuK (DUF458 family) [Cellvibrio fibrivorans]